ncbi:histidine kinase [Thermococcus litoralis DSM 5473]|uniref:Chemotaxis protein CheA n=1 Tax=Thermococcus litoralis (strain ATCC 51850 / DSM 5473 / JCM 8560 / NS-C) TaxID=523849 RepID=H3ZR47_THELN|nr:chemotaxis protein CheA [Thermococcus litoralis]EHR77516.1 histidine kinase [Thermococcus litoralis DSM 5473]
MEDLSQYLDEFLADARDRIDSISNAVISLEEIVKKGGDEREKKELIDQIFRDAHTLKGTAATMGFMRLSETAHKMENLLDAVRNGEIDITPEIVDLVIDFLDAIEKMIYDIEAGSGDENVDVSPLFEKADKLLKGNLEGTTEEKSHQDISEKETAVIHEQAPHVRGDKYHIKVLFQDDAQLKNVRAFLILTDLEEIGEIFGTIPEREIIEEGNFTGDSLEFIVMTSLSPEEIKEKITRHPEVREVIVENVKENTQEENPEKKANEYTIKITMEKEAPLKGVRSFLIVQDLKKIGNLKKVFPEPNKLEKEELIDGKYFGVLLYTNEKKDNITQLILKHPDVEKVEIFEGNKLNEIHSADKREAKNLKSQVDAGRRVKISKMIRVDVFHLDKLMNLVGELVINKGRLEQIAERLGDRELLETLSTTSHLMTELQDEIMEMRLTPVAEVFNKFPRMVRKLAKELGKEVEFKMEGSDIEVDRTILDKLGDVLVHLLRNAIDHGIEPPEERVAKGKPRVGKVELIARREKSHILIIVKDDGKGIDPEKVKKKAIEKGLISPEQAAEMRPEEAINLIFLPGFSTAEKVTDVSGRGVGMDVVQDVIKTLNGSISVKSEVGKGTTFILKLPISMAIIQALLVKISNETYAIPINNILETIDIKQNQLKTIGGKKVIVLREEIIPVFMLHELFGVDYIEKDKFPAIVVDLGAQKVAIGVDELLNKKDIVIKSLGKMLSNIKGFAGATILGDGRVVLIIDINSLFGGISGGL